MNGFEMTVVEHNLSFQLPNLVKGLCENNVNLNLERLRNKSDCWTSNETNYFFQPIGKQYLRGQSSGPNPFGSLFSNSNRFQSELN